MTQTKSIKLCYDFYKRELFVYKKNSIKGLMIRFLFGSFFLFCVFFFVFVCFFCLYSSVFLQPLRTIVFLYAREINPLLLDFFRHGHDISLTRTIPYPGKYHQSWDHACYRHREKDHVGEKHSRTRGRTERPVGVVKTTGTFPHATDRIGSRSSPGPPEGWLH